MNTSYKYLVLQIALIVVAVYTTGDVSAQTKTARPSAALTVESTKPTDNRAAILRAFLEDYDSPLAPHAQTFVEEADKNNLDWKFVVSIAGVESWFGQRIPVNSYNGWGWGVYGDNVKRFASWDEGIVTISTALRTDYMEKRGAKNIYDIGAIYAADPAWANKVMHFMNKIEAFEKEYASRQPILTI